MIPRLNKSRPYATIYSVEPCAAKYCQDGAEFDSNGWFLPADGSPAVEPLTPFDEMQDEADELEIRELKALCELWSRDFSDVRAERLYFFGSEEARR